MTHRIRLASAILLALAAACGGRSTSAAPSLAVSPTARTVLAGSAATTFTATLSDSSDPITWSLTGPGTISPATGAATSYTPPATATATATATLTATAGGLTASATITVNPAGGGTVTVNGTVLLDDGTPLASAPVRIDPGAHATSTAADGTFTVSGVTTPYDLAAVHEAGKVVVAYVGLTRTDPAAVVPTRTAAPPFADGATVSGTVEPNTGCSAGSAPCQTYLGFGSATVTGLAVSNPFTGVYSVPLAWNGAASFQGTLHLLQGSADPVTGRVSFWYGARSGVTVANGQDTAESWAPSSVTALPGATLSGTGTVAPGYDLVNSTLSLVLPGVTIPASSCAARPAPARPPCAPGAFTEDAPGVAGATLTVTVAAQGPNGESVAVTRTGGVANGTGFDYAIQAAPTLQAPADGATGVTTSTAFSWTAFAGGVHTVIFKPDEASDPWYYVYTAGTSTTIPDLSSASASVALPAHGSYGWGISGLAPATIDAWAGPSGPAPANPPTVGDSVGFAFTTR